MASQSDEAALLTLMADSAARVAEATRANTALVEQHELAAATFSSRATEEISRLQGEARRYDCRSLSRPLAAAHHRSFLGAFGTYPCWFLVADTGL